MLKDLVLYMIYDAAGVFVTSDERQEWAVAEAKRLAKQDGTFCDVRQILVSAEKTRDRRVRYHANGTVEQLWKGENDDRQ